MKIIVVALALFMGLSLVPIERNKKWNKLSRTYNLMSEKLDGPYEFLHKHETNPDLKIIDVRVLRDLKQAEELSKKLTKQIHALRMNLEGK